MNPLYPAVATRAHHRCEYCHAPEQVFNFAFEVEHILPRSAQGPTTLVNLALACEACNLYKSHFTTAWDEETQQQVSLFHPRHDDWNTHFGVDLVTAEIQGKTPQGRVTVLRLQLNSAFQLQARAFWIQLGLYP